MSLARLTTSIPMQGYPRLMRSLAACSATERKDHLRNLARTDLYFLIRYIFGRIDIERPWLFDRCRDVEKAPYGHLDIWAREHYKSTIITFAHSIQEILQTHGDGAVGEQVTIGIFSHTRPMAKSFLRQIKRELEDNLILQELFPEILYENPEGDASTWSEDSGLIVRRKGNPKEATVEAWGLVDGMPTGKHFNRMVYDDVVSQKSVTSSEMIQKTTEAWELSRFLGTETGKVKYIGTRYHYNDTYRTIIMRGVVTVRKHPATDDGSFEGTPVLLSQERWEEICQERGPYVVACQMLQEPKADRSQGLQRDWLNWWAAKSHDGMNIYLLVDPANEKKKRSDWTSINVIGLGQDGNRYWIDGIRDRLNMQERADAVIEFHRKYRPLGVGYEKYGMQTDIDYILREQDLQNYRFHVTPLGGTMGKNDRIRRLVPDLAQGKWYWPNSIHKTLYDGTQVDIVEQTLIEEFDPFPVPIHDDTLDSMSRIYDEDLLTTWPRQQEERKERYTANRSGRMRRRTPMSR